MKSMLEPKFDELFQFARHLAAEHHASSPNSSCYLLRKAFSRDLKKLNRISQSYKAVLDQKIPLPAAGEWLVDNIYLINEQAQFIRRNFPKSYCKKLPTLVSGSSKGQKRIYLIILELLKQTNGRCDPEMLKGLLWEYQTVQPLTMGELWAVPLVFRIAIIHKLRILFEKVNQDVLPLKQANLLSKRIRPLLSDISSTVNRCIQMIEGYLDLSNPTVLIYLAKYIRERVESSSLNRWLEARTATHNLSLVELIEDEQRRQSQNRVSAGQLVTSLRQISHIIWDLHFEELSLVDQTLRRDPAAVYPKMDFASRDTLRHVLENLAKHWHLPEQILAEQIVKLADNAGQNPSELEVTKHVGYYLIDEGRCQLAKALKITKSLTYHTREKLTRHPNLIYFSALIAFAGFAFYAILQFIAQLRPQGAAWLILVSALPALILAGEWGVRQLHFLVTIIFPPQRLLKMDFQKGIPKEYSTMVVVPTVITSSAAVESLAHKLEIYYLANQDPHIYFALLTDFADADQENLSGEAELLQETVAKIDELNRKYSDSNNTRFFLFHRKRLWNESEEKWMGWERKRGKLAEFNALLCGEKNSSFSHIHGNVDLLPTIRYVITLDTDTQLPRDSAKGLIGALAHPLNRPVIDPNTKKVVRGYGLLQPRIAISHNSANQSFFARVFGGQSGIDAYSGAISDPYQDLFQRGIFTGKGIYDTRVFHNILWDRIPENMVLSHDLLEGSMVKAGLVTDIELVDDYPATYLNALERMHRWVRGDWQLLPWLGAKVSNRFGKKIEVGLDLICRWQMIDNLRRSLLGPSKLIIIGVLLFNCNRLTMPGWPLITIGASLCFGFIINLYNGFKSGSVLTHHFIRPLFSFVVLPHYALKMIDAIIRTLYRLYVSHRKLLEWVTAEETGKQLPTSFLGIFNKMLAREGLVLVVSAVLWVVSGNIFAITLPLIWLSAPILVHLISRELKPRYEQLDTADQKYLRDITWRTWKFFQETVTTADHDLPPDNLQIDPPNGLAHRTSPTNIGLYLGAVVSAFDFGYLSLTEMLKRLGRTVATLKKLPRWNGHFYNWYATDTLEPLQPIYVSTVDSGNLVGYLLAVKQGILACLEKPVIDRSDLLGLLDMAQWEEKQFSRSLGSLQRQLENYVANPPTTWEEWYRSLNLLQESVSQSIETRMAIENLVQELELLLPWLSNIDDPRQAGLTHEPIGSLKELAIKMETVLQTNLETISNPADQLIAAATSLADELDRLASEHDFSLLYDNKQRFFTIGYHVSDKKLDSSFYDLFASEIRQASVVAIALGQVPMEHWFALKRTMTSIKNAPTLVSWTGTMFEYFMPLILMPNYPNTLWDLTYRMVVRKQIAYTRKKKVPWGISESGYSLQDYNHNYQYHAFGVPGLGLKQGLEKDLVVSPYSTVLAALQEKRLSVKNLKRLEQYQALGIYGFYEAIDFTPERLPKNSSQIIVKSYMAHHQGMIINAIANLLFKNCWQRRFISEPRIEATVPLLQEKVPTRALLVSQPKNLLLLHGMEDQPIELRTFYQANTFLPEARFLSNGRYSVMISNSGSGFTKWKQLALTRWVEDPVKDATGPFYYIRNLNKDQVWSPTYHPCRVEAEDLKMEFSLGKVTFSRTDGDIRTEMQIMVAPDIDAEIREISLTNHSNEPCLLEVTSFLELALAPHEQFQAHPAYSRLFIETEFIPGLDVLLAHRRDDAQQSGPYLAYMMNMDGNPVGALEYETDRAGFIGRGQSVSIPYVVQTGLHLSGTVGAVLDPIFSLRRRVDLPGHRKARFFCITAIAETREAVLDICRKLRYPFQIWRTTDLTVAQMKLELNELGISPQQANIYQWMASQLIYFNSYHEQRIFAVKRNIKGQSGLWPYGISGDYPIVSINYNTNSQIGLADTMLKALKYWSSIGLTVDLVFICREADGYNQSNIEELRKTIDAHTQNESFSELAAHIFTLSYNQLPEDDRNLIAAVAKIQLDTGRGTLISQLIPNIEKQELPPAFPVKSPLESSYSFTAPNPPEDLLFFNGWGGFKPDGSEYLIHIKANDLPPQPWINVIANPRFGFLLSESGGGYTWAENSREFKISPWSNDPVLDPPGEICYLRDEADGLLWSATPLPICNNELYTIRHGQGYSIISHKYREIEHEAYYWTPPDDPVKIIELTLKNSSAESRKLAVTYYLEWTLGVDREKTQPHIVTEVDSNYGALLAHNTYQDNFHDYYGFLDLWTNHPVIERSWTGNRHGFIGRNGSLFQPAGLAAVSLDNRTGAGFNPCGAIQLKIDLKPNEEAVIYILVGAAPNRIAAQQYLQRYRKRNVALQSRNAVTGLWNDILGQVEVTTPDPGFDFLINRWLVYQTVVCRFWARSAFYQSGGAYGYRDQLQDSLALLHTRPDLTRSQILLHAAHQFQEGDVQHWWHQETGYGIRTRYSDDLLWLVYTACRYVEHTGDDRIWDETVPFLSDAPLQPGENERYTKTKESNEKASLYQHCIRAVERASVFGSHSLPLIGGGDWNDGFNKVGLKGRGESIWLAWFLYATLEKFIPVCLSQGDQEPVEKYRLIMEQIVWASENCAWDGQWYRRAYNDQGDPLGSVNNSECQIDCIAQAWAVISGAAPADKAKTAMWSLYHRLVLHDKAIINLLTPPFSQTQPSPGYIQAYPRGVRENGGQYTHGAVWAIIAWAKLGEGNLAGELFRMLNPIYHTQTQREAQTYRVEPYVMAADVYSAPPYDGRGGWTWYTGSAGWMYQAGLEWILGIQRQGGFLILKPCIPEHWPEYQVNYRFGKTLYKITVKNPHQKQTGLQSLVLDGAALNPETARVPLEDDGKTHRVIAQL
ncbi:MAG: glycosyl transferase family 36 [Firmicutes bacterium]|nr:glycosyl transferase family 36 [Bacillota bacterium]